MKKILLGFIAIGILTFVGQFTLMGCDVSNSELKKLELQVKLKELELKEKEIEAQRNVYKSVKIGEQEWMVKNLNVEHFRNGDIIPEAKTNEEWREAGENKQPAWCYYDNNSSNGEKYGKLYNFYAVIDSRSLAPKGWHVPTDAEWTVLTDYLTANEHNGTEGTALKATSGWIDSGNGTDNYGFLGLPSGGRYGSGSFSTIGFFGGWWSSSQFDTNGAWSRYLSYRADGFYRGGANKNYGFSVRCLRD